MEVGYPIGVPAEEVPQGPELVELSTPVDEDSWRYSRFALPWLIWCFLWLVATFCLTFWQQTGDIKNYVNGVPRLYQITSSGLVDEGGMPKELRNLRIAEGWFGFIGIVIALVTFFARPSYQIRKAGGFAAAVLLLVACALAWIAFAVGIYNYNFQQRCPANRRWTFQKCVKHPAWAITAIALDSGVGAGAFLSAVLLVYNTLSNHWRIAPRDWEEAQADATEPIKERVPGQFPQKNVAYVRKMLTGLALAGTMACLAALMVFIVLLHEDREKDLLYGPRGRADNSFNYSSTKPFERAGWPVANTRIRYSVAGMGILTVLANFLPFRSRTIAYVFAFLYLGTGVISMVAFGFDINEMTRWNSSRTPCPKTFDGLQTICPQGSFSATCAGDFCISLFLFIYIVVEYFFMGAKQCQNCDRAFEMNELIKHESSECLARPVRCQICAKSMSFKQFQNHQAHCSVDHVPCKNCASMIPKWGIKSHQEECLRWPVQCTMCEDSFQRADMPHHVMICPNRPSSCDACGETYRSRDMSAHRAVCGEVMVRCESCLGQMQRFRLAKHQAIECARRR